jgi:hypothetical protein
MSGSDGLLSKDELVAAHGGDFKIFAKLDTDGNGMISQDEFLAYLKSRHAEKGAKKAEKGDQWLRQLLFTLRSGWTGIRTKELDVKWEGLMKEARDVHATVLSKVGDLAPCPPC